MAAVSIKEQGYEYNKRKEEELGNRMHQRYDELMYAGMDNRDAEAQVKREYSSEIQSLREQKSGGSAPRQYTKEEIEEPETPSFRAAIKGAWGEAKRTVKEAPARVVHNIGEGIKTSRIESKLKREGYHQSRRKGAAKAGEEQYIEEKDLARKKRELLHELDSIEAKGRLKTRLKTYEIRTTGRAHADVQQMKTVHVAPIRPRVFRNQYGQVIPYDPDPLGIYSLSGGEGQAQQAGYDPTAMYELLGYHKPRVRSEFPLGANEKPVVVHPMRPVTFVRPESREQGFSSVGVNNFIDTFLGGGTGRQVVVKESNPSTPREVSNLWSLNVNADTSMFTGGRSKKASKIAKEMFPW